MARIPMTSGFALIPEGTYVFRIYDAKYDEEFGKIEVKLVNAAGMTHTERFFIKDKNDEMNEKALNAFSYFAKVALNDFSLTEIDHEDLVGCFIRCEVDHEEVESNRTPGKMLKFVRLGDKEPADGFDEAPAAPAPAEKKEPAAKPATQAGKAGGKKPFDLNSILG